MSFKNLFVQFVVRFMFRKVSQTSLGLEKAGLDSRFSPAACLPDRGVALAKKGDIILLAGKGHENYQEINGVKNHFDDKEVLSEAFKEAN